jgi:hypothetical protein
MNFLTESPITSIETIEDEDISCMNFLEMDSSIEELGLAFAQNKQENSTNVGSVEMKLKIQFLKKFMKELTGECSEYEMSFRYMAKYKKLESFTEYNLNLFDTYNSSVTNNKKNTIKKIIQNKYLFFYLTHTFKRLLTIRVSN